MAAGDSLCSHDSDGWVQFMGEDLGHAFDVVGRRKQTGWKKTASDTYEAAFEITIRNHKQEDATVRVVEPVPGDWQMLNSTLAFAKGAAHTAEFDIPVKKDEEAPLPIGCGCASDLSDISHC